MAILRAWADVKGLRALAACLAMLPCAAAPAEDKPAAPPAAAALPLPEGVARQGFDLLAANDFAGAERAFADALVGAPNDLKALEGLRSACVAQGLFEKALEADLKMVRSGAADARIRVFATRAVNMLLLVDAREAVEKALRDAMEKAPEASRIYLADRLATLCLQSNRPDEARRLLANLGYVTRWAFVAGPYGWARQYHTHLIDRRFAPESSLKDLDWRDERGKRIWVARDARAPFRDLDVRASLLSAEKARTPEAPLDQGVYYALANISSPQEQDATLSIRAGQGARVFLRGMPVYETPGERRYERRPGLVRTRLLRGDNPLLVKVQDAQTISVQVLSPDFGLVPQISFDGPSDETLASHRVLPVRGLLFSQETEGPLASWFRARHPGLPKAEGEESLAPLAGLIDLSETAWLEYACADENDVEAREALARSVLASADRSVHFLDFAASLLAGVAASGRHCPTRLPEEARALREKALAMDPRAHQPLLAMASFFRERDLKDQAHEKALAAVKAHPKSAAARASLADSCAAKEMWVQSERELARAAELQPAFLPRLARFLDEHSSKPKAWEIYRQLHAGGRLSSEEWFGLLLRREQFAEAEKALDALAAARPDQKGGQRSDRLALARAKGDAEAAYAIAAEILKEEPTSRQALVGLADLAIGLKKQDEAERLIEGWLAVHRNDLELRARLSDLRGQKERWWEKHDVRLSDIDASPFTQEKYPRSNHAWLVDFMVTRILPDYSAESYVHIAKKVLNQDGVEELGELPVEARGEDVVFIRTVHPDGQVYVPEHIENFSFSQAASMYKLRPGSIVEYAYIDRRPADEVEPNLTMGFNFMALDAPRARSQWVVIAPKSLPLDIHKVLPERIAETIVEDPAAGTVVYDWRNAEVEGIKVEPYMPPDDETIPHVWMRSPERPAPATGLLARTDRPLKPRGVQELAAAIVKDCRSDEERFRAILSWVRANMKEGSAAWSLEDVLAMKSGTRAQLADLSRELGRAAGLNVYQAYANRGYRPGWQIPLKSRRRDFEPQQLVQFGSGGQFLALERREAPMLWFQFFGTPPHLYPVEAVAEVQANACALIFRDRGIVMQFVMGDAMGRAAGSHTVACALEPDGKGLARGSIAFHGVAAGGLRKVLSDPRRESQIRERMVRQFWPTAKIEESSIAPMDKPDEPLVAAYVASLANAATPAEGKFFVTPFLQESGILRLMGPAEREHDLMVNTEVSCTENGVEWIAPEGHAWVEVPDDVAVATEFGFYFLDFQARGRSLFCTRAMLIPMQRISREKHPEFLKFLSHIHAVEKERAGYGLLAVPGFQNLARAVWSRGYARGGQDLLDARRARAGEAEKNDRERKEGKVEGGREE